MRVARRVRPATIWAPTFLAGAGLAAAVPSLAPLVALTGTTVLIMGGTQHPLSTPPDTIPFVQDYLDMAIDNYVAPSASVGGSAIPAGPYNPVAVITPEENFPSYGTLTLTESVTQGLAKLDSCLTSTVCDYNQQMGSAAPASTDTFVVFGYSQSATIAMLEKAALAAEYADGEGPDVTFVVIAGPRPNGSLSTRDPEGLVSSLFLLARLDEMMTRPAPTDTQYETVSIAGQYDGYVDFPRNPLNLLASLNAYMGIAAIHPNYAEHRLDDPDIIDQGQYGDTHYYMIATEVLPLLNPVAAIPVIGAPLADFLDPALRVIVESAYDRSVSPGVPTPFDTTYAEDPATVAANVLAAIPAGFDNAVQNLTGHRPLGTERPGSYGIGGSDESAETEEPEGFDEITGSDESDDPDEDRTERASSRKSGAAEADTADTADRSAHDSAASGASQGSRGSGGGGSGERQHKPRTAASSSS